MSTNVSFNLQDVTNPITVTSEYTDPSVNSFWAQEFGVINNIFQTPSANLTQQDGADLWAAVNSLRLAAINGFDTATGQPLLTGQQPQGQKAYITFDMANSLNLLIKSLETAGFDTVNPPGSTDLTSQIKQWQDLNQAGVSNILIQLGDAVTNNRTLQSMIELEYVKQGNDILGNNLQDLQSAMQVTYNALNELQLAQTLKNKLQAATRSIPNPTIDGSLQQNQWSVTTFGQVSPSDPLPGGNSQQQTVEGYTQAYKVAMQDAFGNPIGVDLTVTQSDITQFVQVINKLADLKNQLQQQYDTQLQAAKAAGTDPSQYPAPPPLIQDIDTVIGDMNATGAANQPPIDIPDVTLASQFGYSALTYNNQTFPANSWDINPSSTTALQRMLYWIYDGYSSTNVTQSGQYQTDLTTAITSGQNLNDTQKEDLQRYMYLFQQFYQSASSILQSMTSIITKMGQNIRG